MSTAATRHFAVSAVGRDRPGIVAAVSAVLLDHGANVEDSQMTILRGHFTMVLVIATPATADADALRADLSAAGERLRLEGISLASLDEAGPGEEPVPSLIVTVYGADHPGILHAFASAVAELGIDITDLNTRLVGEPDEPVYALMMELAPPPALEPGELGAVLDRLAAEQGVDITMRPLDSDIL